MPSSTCEQADGLRPDARDAEDLEQAVRDLGPQPLVVLEAAGLGELGELGGQRRAGTRQLRRLAALEERGDVIRIALDGVGDAAIGDRLVDDLAEDLEHVADLVEDPRQLGALLITASPLRDTLRGRGIARHSRARIGAGRRRCPPCGSGA